MIEKTWKSLSGETINLLDAINHEINTSEVPVEIHIGSDSQQDGKNTVYVSVVVVQKVGRGGRVFYTREKVTRIKSLRERLHKEVWHTTEIAMELTTEPDIGASDVLSKAQITLHIDANPDPQYKSSEYVKELASLAMGQGFRTFIKPDAWAAGHAADHIVKGKNHRNLSKKEKRKIA